MVPANNTSIPVLIRFPTPQYFSYYDIEDPTSMITALKQLDNYIVIEGPFDSVLGYSHGAGLAAMLPIAKPNTVTLKFAIISFRVRSCGVS